MRCVSVPKREAQEAKRYLLEQGMLDTEYQVRQLDEEVLFPVTATYKGRWQIHEDTFQRRKTAEQAISFKEALRKVLSAEELERANTAYELVGNVAVIEVPTDLEEKKTLIAQTLLESNPKITTVLGKVGGHEGTYRTQHMEVLAGEPTTIATYRENNCTITYDLNDMYFSARLASERKRIAALVQPGEDILIMFSGAAPYQCVIARNTEAKRVVGVEINPKAHEFAKRNTVMNKLDNVENYCGDARTIVPELDRFDRVIMPLPRTAHEFLDVAINACKPRGTIHYYGFYHEEEFEKAKAVVGQACEHEKVACEIMDVVKVGQQSPRTYRVCVDFRVE